MFKNISPHLSGFLYKTVCYDLTPVRMGTIKKVERNKSRAGKDVEKWEPLCSVGGNVEQYGGTPKTNRIIISSGNSTSYTPQNLKAGSRRATSAAMVSRHESRELERGAPQASMDREEGRQNVAHVHSGRLQPSQRLQHGAAFRTVG